MTAFCLGLMLCGVCILGIVYPHAIYPALLWLLAKLFGKPVSMVESPLPTIDVLICAYNEASNIEECIRLVQTSNYPADRVRILVADDGSNDSTPSIVQHIANNDSRVVLSRLERGGKNKALDHLIDMVNASIVVFIDADALVDETSIRELVQPLANPLVGAVIGMHSTGSDGRQSGSAESWYTRIEHSCSVLESEIHSTVTSVGAMYAVRREYVERLNTPLVADDFMMILRVMLQKKRVVCCRTARFREIRTPLVGVETKRTTRTVASGMWALRRARRLLTPKYGWVAFFLWSHKIARWISPFFVIVLVLSTWLTLERPMVFGVLFYTQLFVVALALLSNAAGTIGWRVKPALIAEYFILMNVSIFLAWLRFAGVSASDTWTPGKS